jgi:hypothetical protein
MGIEAVAGQGGPGSMPTRTVCSALVIADRGSAAEVLLVQSDHELTVGSCFSHLGVEWRIIGRRPHGRALVAVPAISQ